MAYTAGLQMLMDNLKKLIHGNHHPLINNNPTVLSERPRFQLLYQELDSIIQTLSNTHQHYRHHNPDELEKDRNIKKRLKDVAEEAQDIIDLYLSALTVDFRNSGLSPGSDVFKTSLDLENVMRSIESIKGEFMTLNMKTDLLPRIDCLETQSTAAGTLCTRNPLGMKKPLMEDDVVGLDDDVNLIKEKLAEGTKQLGIVSIVGMGGIGKTTLATKVFNDPSVVHHFHARAWVTVSQTYIKQDFLIRILRSIGVEKDLEETNDYQLRGDLHKKLMGRRYLIVIDDIWSIADWNDLIVLFPHEDTNSRILLTSRLNKVALHAKPDGYIHSLPYLTEERSWNLLCKKVFNGDKCPEWLIEPGMQIAKKCQGLPLSVVVMAGVLAKEERSKDLWEKFARSVTSYIVGDQKGILETLALSYQHLPHHLRECFLYLGGFPEDQWFNVKRLTWLWGAEGFIEKTRNASLEDTAKAYLMELVDRNLLIVAKWKFNGDVRSCKLHDLVRELCVEKAKEERFFLKMDPTSLPSQLPEIAWEEQRRVFTNQDICIKQRRVLDSSPTVRSLFWFHKSTSLIGKLEACYLSFALLKVMDIQKCKLENLPDGIALLVNLRYLAIWLSQGFPSSICNLWSLETLVLHTRHSRMVLPSNISNLVNLRHLRSNKGLLLPTIEKSMDLQSISDVMFGHRVNFEKWFPSIQKLVVTCNPDDENHLSFPCLETVKLTGGFRQNHIWFPPTLKKLTLVKCNVPWSDMSIIRLLPKLEVLKLKENAFVGTKWNAGEQKFQQLKFLRLEKLNIQQWEAYSTNFPCLRRLTLWRCNDLEEIPLEIGEIRTLELIETDSWNNSLVESVRKIKNEQLDEGNTELKITVDGMELSTSSSEHEG